MCEESTGLTPGDKALVVAALAGPMLAQLVREKPGVMSTRLHLPSPAQVREVLHTAELAADLIEGYVE